MDKDNLHTNRIISTYALSSWIFSVFFLFVAAMFLTSIEGWKYRLFFIVGSLLNFLLFFCFKKSKLSEPQNLVSILGASIGIIVLLTIFIFGQDSLIPKFIVLGLCIASASYVFSLRKYRGTLSEIDYLQDSRYGWKRNKFILTIALPLLFIGIAIIVFAGLLLFLSFLSGKPLSS